MKAKICIIFAVASVLFGAFIMLVGFLCYHCGDDAVLKRITDYGTFFTIVAAFWSLAAFLLIFATFEEQKGQFERQSFENCFFQLISVQNSITDKLEDTKIAVRMTPPSVTIKGLEIFEHNFGLLKFSLEGSFYLSDLAAFKIKNPTIPNPEVAFSEKTSTDFLKPKIPLFGHYFRSLYHVFKFIDESSVTDSQKLRYAGIMRSQLSQYELGMLFYNGISEYGCESFKPLIEKFALLKNLKIEDLPECDITNRHLLYDKAAFGK